MFITAVTQKIENWALKADILYKIAEKHYLNIIKKEVILANITRNDHILCIGGGICPFSAILIHRVTGARVDVIDNNSGCVYKARQIISRMGVDKFITSICQDGRSENLLFSRYTVVHFALQVCPMECVFFNIENRVFPGTKLLVRAPKNKLRKLYYKLPEHLHSCPKTIHKNARGIGSTLLYIKEEGPKIYEKTSDSSAVCGDFTSPAYTCPVAN